MINTVPARKERMSLLKKTDCSCRRILVLTMQTLSLQGPEHQLDSLRQGRADIRSGQYRCARAELLYRQQKLELSERVAATRCANESAPQFRHISVAGRIPFVTFCLDNFLVSPFEV